MKLYIFDMGEVLLMGVRTLKRMAEQYGIDYKEFRADYAHYDMSLMDGLMDPSLYYRHMEIKWGIKVDEDLFDKYFDPSINYEVLGMIDSLRARGDRAVIGSNTFEPHWKSLFNGGRYSELVKHFDALYASHEINISKPNTAFWRIIMEKEGFSAKDVYFIDDRKDNIEGASSLGITCFEYHENNEDLKAFLAL